MEEAAELEAAEKAAEAVAAADGVARDLSSSVAGDHPGDSATAETAGAVAATAECASTAEARVAEAQAMEAKRVAEERAGAAEETAEAAQLQIEQLREADEGRWQRMSPWATGAVGLLIRLRMSSFVFATSVLAGASALAALSITSFAFLALSCLRFNIIAVPYGAFPNVVSPLV
eukprot:scaffold34381_cov66-Phaeocystis_antarctica.AAC.1